MAATPRTEFAPPRFDAARRSNRVRAYALASALVCALAVAQTPLPSEPSPTPAIAPSSARQKPPDDLRPGEYRWTPELAPKGPVVLVVSLPEQRAYVYRNGVRIAVSTVSTGMPGYETPTGVFTILQKSREHYSNLYDDAPMPFMQRLTWTGVALHAGKIVEYPASHGCVRLPYAFSEKLFGITQRGMVVVIADERSHAPTIAFPGLFAPVDPATGDARKPAHGSSESAYRWMPELAPDGPLTIVMSAHDREVAILRNGIEIGRAAVVISDDAMPHGTQAYVLLEGSGDGASKIVPDRPALRWMRLTLREPQRDTPSQDARNLDALGAAERGEIRVAPDFAQRVYDVLQPGTTLIVTDEPLHTRENAAEDGISVLRADRPDVAEPSADERLPL